MKVMKMELILVTSFLCLLPCTLGYGRFARSLRSRNKLLEFECETRDFLCLNKVNCVGKHLWCNGYSDCPDGSDEHYCDNNSECPFIGSYFKCDNGACIPSEADCDGYPTCGDGSDELGCQCEEILEKEESIDFKVHIGRKGSKCWKIVVSSTQYLSLNVITLNLQSDNCYDAYLMISGERATSEPTKLCPKNHIFSLERFETTEIRYHGNSRVYHSPESEQDFDKVFIDLIVADLLCKRSDSFKCTTFSCILPEKKCDGARDCFNGADESGCERGVNAVPGVNATRNKGISWLKKQRNAAWGWRDNTHRAVVALYLAQGANFNGTDKEEDLTAKQLELQMTTAILRNETEPISATQLAMYVNALLVICHDPRNFYGYNLVRMLQDQTEISTNAHYPLTYLALCNANVTLSDNAVAKLSRLLESSSEHSFLTDVQSVAVVALSCLSRKGNFSYLKSIMNETTNRFKKSQNEDGSFGNIYTTALVVQALLSSGNEEDKDWDLKAAIEFLQSKQNKENGYFEDFLATTLILPILNAKSLSDIGNISCTENLKMPRDGNPVLDIELRLGRKMNVKYYLYIGNKKDQVHPIVLRTPANITVLDVMRIAAEADPKYRFEAQSSNDKLYIYKINGISNDPEDGKFWLLYTKTGNETVKITSKSPDKISVHDKDDIIMWYRRSAAII